MIEKDTIELLKECDAGVKMGMDSIKDILDYVKDKNMKAILTESLKEHDSLQNTITKTLAQYGDDGKEPNIMAKGMSWLKTNVKLGIESSDEMIADIVTDGCDMGVKSLSKYMNKYKAADEFSKDIAKKTVAVENKLRDEVRAYL